MRNYRFFAYVCLPICFLEFLSITGCEKAHTQHGQESWREILTFEGHKASGGTFVDCVLFGPDARWVASASWEGQIKLWDVATAMELRTLEGKGGPIASISASPDGKKLAAAMFRGSVKVWDIKTGEEAMNIAP